MTASDVLRIAGTVATIQCICDLLAHWRIYSQEKYERSLSQLSRAKFKRDKAREEADQITAKEGGNATTPAASSNSKKASKAERQAKKLQRAEDDFGNAKASVARWHTAPNMWTSALFFLILRILGTEYKGKVVAVLPFVPFKLLRRLTSRNLEFDALTTIPELEGSKAIDDLNQACAFMFIYLLTTMSVKFYVNRILGTKPPEGAEGIMAIMESPVGQNMLKSAGVDASDLKAD